MNTQEYKGFTIVTKALHVSTDTQRSLIYNQAGECLGQYCTVSGAKAAITRRIKGDDKWAAYKAEQQALNAQDAVHTAEPGTVRHEPQATYSTDASTQRAAKDSTSFADSVIANALQILKDRLAQPGAYISSPDDVKNFLRLQCAEYKSEAFWCMWLSTCNKVIGFERLFTGSIADCSVYPREVIKAALNANAAAVIFVHNHPSGDTTPSQPDVNMTRKLATMLGVIGVQIFDHMIVGGSRDWQGEIEATSMRELGYAW